jgi:hypothetical protein
MAVRAVRQALWGAERLGNAIPCVQRCVAGRVAACHEQLRGIDRTGRCLVSGGDRLLDQGDTLLSHVHN